MLSVLFAFFSGILTVAFISKGIPIMSAVYGMIFGMNIMNVIGYIHNKFKK